MGKPSAREAVCEDGAAGEGPELAHGEARNGPLAVGLPRQIQSGTRTTGR
jgi:hypothetical protein